MDGSVFHGKRRVLSLLLIASIIVSGSSFYYFLQTRDNEAPLIEDLEWKPTKVVNDKVYDGSISFKARDEGSIIAEATVNFVPNIYPDLPKEAFPNETSRNFKPLPVDGKFDEAKEEFELNVSDIKGGREYDIRITLKDNAGNIGEANLTTPYIREFENLGRQLYEKGMKVGIIYGLITKQHEWDNYLNLGGPYKPLLGYYVLNSTENLMVIEKHMDWMSGHGVNFILDIWSGKESEGDIRDGVFREALSKLDIFRTGGMKFGISYESHWRFVSEPGTINMSDPRNIQILNEDLSYLTENYFSHPAYLKIDGKPFFYIYMNKGMGGDVIGGLEEVYRFMEEYYGIQLYMVSDHALPEVDENWGGAGGGTIYTPVKDLAPLFDAMVTGMHTYDYSQWGTIEDYVEMGFKYWYKFSLSNGLDYIPYVNPGNSAKYTPWHSPEARETDIGAYPRSIEIWKKRLEMCVPYSKTFGMMVGDFNNVAENQHIEPTVQEGFSYLEALKDVLTAPTIYNLSWSPLDVRNDKVYSLKVEFEAEDIAIGSESPSISDAEMQFIPVEYTDFPKEAFPEDNIRKYELTPLDGSYGNITEKFAVNITDIIGGREYEIRVKVIDIEGNERIASFNTPYIREFENLGNQLYEKGIKIGLYYGLISEQFEWDNPLKLGLPYKPLLGYYLLNSTDDLTVIEKHMDWMSGHGINFVMFLWSGNSSYIENIRNKIYLEAISRLEMFKTGGMKFGISYGLNDISQYNMSDSRNIQILKEDLSYLVENYFKHPAYLKINGKPFFYFYMCKGMSGDIFGGLEEVYRYMEKKYGIEIYMVSDHGLTESSGEPLVEDLKQFCAIITGIHHSVEYSRWGTWEDYLEAGFRYWYNFSLRNGFDFIPCAIPGASAKYCSWHPPELRESDPWAYPRSIELWKKRLELAIPYSNTFGIMVGDFNNFFENWHLEPTVQEGFTYLEAMKEVLTEYFLILF